MGRSAQRKLAHSDRFDACDLVCPRCIAPEVSALTLEHRLLEGQSREVKETHIYQRANGRYRMVRRNRAVAFWHQRASVIQQTNDHRALCVLTHHNACGGFRQLELQRLCTTAGVVSTAQVLEDKAFQLIVSNMAQQKLLAGGG